MANASEYKPGDQARYFKTMRGRSYFSGKIYEGVVEKVGKTMVKLKYTDEKGATKRHYVSPENIEKVAP